MIDLANKRILVFLSKRNVSVRCLCPRFLYFWLVVFLNIIHFHGHELLYTTPDESWIDIESMLDLPVCFSAKQSHLPNLCWNSMLTYLVRLSTPNCLVTTRNGTYCLYSIHISRPISCLVQKHHTYSLFSKNQSNYIYRLNKEWSWCGIQFQSLGILLVDIYDQV